MVYHRYWVQSIISPDGAMVFLWTELIICNDMVLSLLSTYVANIVDVSTPYSFANFAGIITASDFLFLGPTRYG
jgi:hypothetical protein